jgi:DNA-binding transcriptional LysR family regulator
MAPDLRQLSYFVALAEELSFTAAAARCFVTQQSLSRSIAQLERDVGRPLFVRSTRSVELTDAGRRMLAPARRALRAAEETVEAVQGAGSAPAPVRVDISSGGLRVGAEIVRELGAGSASVHQVEVGVRAGLGMLRAGLLDVVLGLAPSRSAGIESMVVHREPVVVGVSADHHWAGRDSVPVAELGTERLLLPSHESAGEWREFVADACAQAGITMVPWRNVTHGSVAAGAEVRSGHCVVPTTEWTEPPAGLVFIPLVDPVPIFPWSLMWAAGRGDDPVVRAVRAAATVAGDRLGW